MKKILLCLIMFLSGNLPAHDPRRALSTDGILRIQDISAEPTLTTQFALFDMNADALPELHLRPITDGLYVILTYKNEQVTLLYLLPTEQSQSPAGKPKSHAMWYNKCKGNGQKTPKTLQTSA